jgi:hypothetical protein
LSYANIQKKGTFASAFKFLTKKIIISYFFSAALVAVSAVLVAVSAVLAAVSSVLAEVSSVLAEVSASEVPLLPEQAAKANIAQAAIAK